MQRATIVSDFPILSASVARQLGLGFEVETRTWNDFLEYGPTVLPPDLLVVDVTTVGEAVGLALVSERYGAQRLAVASLHTNEVKLYRADGGSFTPSGSLPDLVRLRD